MLVRVLRWTAAVVVMDLLLLHDRLTGIHSGRPLRCKDWRNSSYGKAGKKETMVFFSIWKGQKSTIMRDLMAVFGDGTALLLSASDQSQSRSRSRRTSSSTTSVCVGYKNLAPLLFSSEHGEIPFARGICMGILILQIHP